MGMERGIHTSVNARGWDLWTTSYSLAATLSIFIWTQPYRNLPNNLFLFPSSLKLLANLRSGFLCLLPMLCMSAIASLL